MQPFVQLTSELLINRRIILFSREALFSLFEMKHAIEKVKQKLLETEKNFFDEKLSIKKIKRDANDVRDRIEQQQQQQQQQLDGCNLFFLCPTLQNYITVFLKLFHR